MADGATTVTTFEDNNCGTVAYAPTLTNHTIDYQDCIDSERKYFASENWPPADLSMIQVFESSEACSETPVQIVLSKVGGCDSTTNTACTETTQGDTSVHVSSGCTTSGDDAMTIIHAFGETPFLVVGLGPDGSANFTNFLDTDCRGTPDVQLPISAAGIAASSRIAFADIHFKVYLYADLPTPTPTPTLTSALTPTPTSSAPSTSLAVSCVLLATAFALLGSSATSGL